MPFCAVLDIICVFTVPPSALSLLSPSLRSPPCVVPFLLILILVLSMSCQHAYLTRPHTIIATFATFLFFFVPQAWAAPHSINLARRDSSSSGSKIVVRLRLTCVAYF